MPTRHLPPAWRLARQRLSPTTISGKNVWTRPEIKNLRQDERVTLTCWRRADGFMSTINGSC
jgi:hypothetical protein